MPFVDLATVQHRVTLGAPLPFNVRSADQSLLLARGQRIASAEQLVALLRRGTLVDTEELAAADPPTARTAIEAARPEELPALWRNAVRVAQRTLEAVPTEDYAAAVDGAADPLIAVIERDPDLAIFQVLRQEGNYHTQYGVNHSIHCAIAAFLVGTRFGWSEPELRRAFKAALTMNLSMLELQGQLASQATPLSDEQRERIHAHPERSAAMLEAAGITDADWLLAVRQHHEREDGTGYASGCTEVSELASLLHRTDVYTAKLSPRRNREALNADVAARMVYASDRGHPTTAAIVKEFGLYPPGCPVRLANGETGFVVRRGEQAHSPRVAVTTDAQGMALPRPVRRDTASTPFKVTAVLRSGTAALRFSPEVLQQVAWAA
jgi:HD-GYP domain-containing protein (c-di-GMP phosphodiesterase class II)